MILFNSIDDWAIVILILLTALVSVFLYLLIKNSKNNSTDDYKVLNVTNETETHFFNYLSLYFLPCIGLSISRISDIFVIIFLVGLAGVVYVSYDLVYINPILTIFKYDTYLMELKSIKSGEILKKIIITKEKDCGKLIGENIQINQSEGKYTVYTK